jgi:non-canonical purine NTP pyrophosphatase (RdgB/HAM1 family)
MEVVFVTGNAAKVEQLQRFLELPVSHHALDLYEVQSLDLREIVEAKAREAYRHIGKPVLVEDSSLVFNALGQLPGPFIKWFEKTLGNDGLCQLLNGFEDRSAHAEVGFGLFDGETFRLFKGEMDGEIVEVPHGDGGFGWDPIFIMKESGNTRAELSEEEYKATSMRRIATGALKEFLSQNE